MDIIVQKNCIMQCTHAVATDMFVTSIMEAAVTCKQQCAQQHDN